MVRVQIDLREVRVHFKGLCYEDQFVKKILEKILQKVMKIKSDQICSKKNIFSPYYCGEGLKSEMYHAHHPIWHRFYVADQS